MAQAGAKPSRPKLVQQLYRLLDDEGSGYLGPLQLRRFAECCGFEGNDEEWLKEFREVCSLYEWSQHGPDLRQFSQLVNDRKGFGYSNDAEIQAIIGELQPMQPPPINGHKPDSRPQSKQSPQASQPTSPRSPRSPGSPRQARFGAEPVAAGPPAPTSWGSSALPEGQAAQRPIGNQARGQGRSQQQRQNGKSAQQQQQQRQPTQPRGRQLQPGDLDSPGHSRSVSPTRNAATAQDEVDPPELDADVLQFVEWATGHWEMLRNLFMAEDKNQYIVKGSIGRRGLTCPEWTRKLKALGFHGNAKAVFEEIARECKGDKDERRPERLPGSPQNVRNTVYVESISLSQLMRFETRVNEYTSTLAATHDGSAVSRFVKLLQQQRGCVLRAWRLDLDKRGTGRVAFADFTQACRQLGVPTQARLVWNALRSRDDSRPLEFADLGGEEAANLDVLAETLWNTLGFDLEKAWLFMDINGQQWLSAEEFEAGVRKLGFDGNARQLFRGLDTAGLGRVWRTEFDYIRLATRVPPRKLQQSSGALADLIQWVQRELGGIEELLDALAIGEHGEMTVGDLAVHLAALGFEGDALQAAIRAARNEGAGTKITANSLRQLFACTPQAPPASQEQGRTTRNLLQKKRVSQAGAPPRQDWDSGVHDLASVNLARPKGLRNYFSMPYRDEDGNRSPVQRKPQRSRSTVKPCWNEESSGGDKPHWNGEVFTATGVNSDLPSSRRLYFSDASNKPVREAMKRAQSARSLREAGPKQVQPPPAATPATPVDRFVSFVLARFGSLEKAFRRLDVEGSGLLRQKDFIREVQQAGFPEKAEQIFPYVDRQKRGIISLRDFLSLQEFVDAVGDFDMY
mmetsp:Transcript_133618/g.266597  ORF Transcript_133618/g.266597 Transcript_133618/m.266597 type:complete len:854 (+) Transcript_133618:39-2600(+)